MTRAIGEDDDLKVTETNIAAPAHVVDPHAATELEERTNRIAILPHPPEKRPDSLLGRVTHPAFDNPIAPVLEKLSDYAESATRAKGPLPHFPDAARELVQLIVAKDATSSQQVQGHILKVNKIHGNITLLIEFSKELSQMEEGQTELSERAKEILSELEKNDIHLRKTDKPLTAKQVEGLSQTASNYSSKLKDEMARVFKFQIEMIANQIATIVALAPDILKQWNQAAEATRK